jgi:predicted PurR-regulated permease PerM
METLIRCATDIEPEEPPDVPVQRDIKAVFQGGMFLLALLAAFYVASDILFPVVLAFILMLVLQPVMRFFEKLYLPRSIAAVEIIVVLFGGFVGFGAALSEPTASWAQKLPGGLPSLEERLPS